MLTTYLCIRMHQQQIAYLYTQIYSFLQFLGREQAINANKRPVKLIWVGRDLGYIALGDCEATARNVTDMRWDKTTNPELKNVRVTVYTQRQIVERYQAIARKMNIPMSIFAGALLEIGFEKFMENPGILLEGFEDE